MSYFRIKVCGITNIKDALLADSLGVDMLGFVFYRKSPRYLSPQKAASIIKKLPPTIDRVGVFVDENFDTISRFARRLKLDYVQLHGKQSLPLITRLQKAGFKVIQSVHIQKTAHYREALSGKADIIHLDNSTQIERGGTGERFDWSIRPPRRIPNLMLAGGLNADNIKEGIKRFGPLAVDVNSGVEQKPGVKSAAKLKKFINCCNLLRDGSKS